MEQVFTAKGKTLPPTQEIFMKDLLAFLALVIQMGYDHKPSITSYWTKDELYHVPFYSNVMSQDRFLTILKYLHFTKMKIHLLKTEMTLITTGYGKVDKYLTY